MLRNLPNVLMMAEVGFLTSYPTLPDFMSCSVPCHVEIINKDYINSVYMCFTYFDLFNPHCDPNK